MATVTEHQTANNKFPGKKQGELAIKLDNSETVVYALRVDSKEGTWIAVDGAAYYVAQTKGDLVAHMRAVAIAGRVRDWSRYIVVEYEAEIPQRDSWKHSHLSLKDKRDGLDSDNRLAPCLGLRLRFQVRDYTQPFTSPGETRVRRKARTVSKADTAEPDGYSTESWAPEELPLGAIPYTRSRLEHLQNIQRALAGLDRRMLNLLLGTPDELASRFDQAISHNNITTGANIRALLGG